MYTKIGKEKKCWGCLLVVTLFAKTCDVLEYIRVETTKSVTTKRLTCVLPKQTQKFASKEKETHPLTVNIVAWSISKMNLCFSSQAKVSIVTLSLRTNGKSCL